MRIKVIARISMVFRKIVVLKFSWKSSEKYSEEVHMFLESPQEIWNSIKKELRHCELFFNDEIQDSLGYF